MNCTLSMNRVKAIQLLGKKMEKEVFEHTDGTNYALIVRKVLQGNSVFDAIKIKGPEEEKVFDVAEGDLTCPKCKSKKIIRKEMQTRSADESATVFCECFDCKKRFKF